MQQKTIIRINFLPCRTLTRRNTALFKDKTVNYKQRLLGVFFSCCFLPIQAAPVESANLLMNINGSKNATLANCTNAKSLQNCTVQITQNIGCLSQPGSISITNNSKIMAKNIQASSSNPNFTRYVVQNNGCPPSLASGASCSISFYTNAYVAFTAGDVVAKGSNTNGMYFNLNAYLCTASLTASTPVLGLARSGTSRQFTITNNSSIAATNVAVQPSGLPSGTSFASTCSGTLNAGSSCTITVTPGAAVSADANGNACTSGSLPNSTLTVSAEQFLPTSVGIAVLDYGCIYQAGYVFAIDDSQGCTSSPCLGGVGGVAVALIDQAPANPAANGIAWSSNGISIGGGTTPDVIPEIDDLSTTAVGSPSYATFAAWFNTTYGSGASSNLPILPASAFNSCNAITDGKCNSANILAFYNAYQTSIPAYNPPTATPLSYYAAGLCSTLSSEGFADWYLPAICQQGLQSFFGVCSSVTGNNIVSNLPFLVGDANSATPSTSCPLGYSCLAGNYWASTAWSTDYNDYAWYEYFDSTGVGSLNHFDVKNATHGVRCVRNLSS